MASLIGSDLSRRRFLQGAAAIAGAAAFRGLGASDAHAARLAPLVSGRVLPNPDFARLHPSAPCVIGVRPHRRGGVRLEMESAPMSSPSGNKLIVHNYGHGGGGITLSWGCAAAATDLVDRAIALARRARLTPSVAVLGTGVIGLTTATEIRRKWPSLPIAVYAKDLDVRTTTSYVAGGQFEPSGIFREHSSAAQKRVFTSYLRRSRDRIVGILNASQGADFGIDVRKNYTLDHSIPALDGFTDVVPRYRRGTLPFAKLNSAGREYTTWLQNPHILLPKLRTDLAAASVQFVQRQFNTRRDVAALSENVIVNCTGLGAKTLFGDNHLVPERGHLVLLQKTDPDQSYFFSGDCMNDVICYVFCRQDDIVIGGTVLSGHDAPRQIAADADVFQRILGNATAVFDGRASACVPTRT
jgi:glycine/D-amino acid oxidase-like deaminating enzyme